MYRIFEKFRGQGIKTRFRNPYDAFWDWKLGVETFGYHPASGVEGDSDWRLHYTPTPYSDIFRLLKMVGLSKDDVFVDLGAGLGRAVFAASWLGAGRAIGIEVVQNLCDRALENTRHSVLSHDRVDFICTHALNYRHGDTTVLFMFHPFGEETMRQVIHDIGVARIGIEGADRKRQLRIIYMNPVFDRVLEQSGWLERYGRLPPKARWFSTANSYFISLWRSVP